MYSKKVKLPRSQWVKGRSKFLFCRLMEEGQAIKTQVSQSWLKKWLIKFYARFRLFTQIKK
jgi:hypothetical protein